MAEYAEVENGVAVNVIIAEPEFIAEQPGTWVDITNEAGVGIGWQWDGTTWTEPAPPAPVTRYVLTGLEWVQTWTEDEWRSLKTLAQQDTTPGRRLDQLLDAIKLTNSVDLESGTMQQFYSYIVAQGWITQARADELQAGIQE